MKYRLEEYRQDIEKAHYNISFDPEKRAETIIQEFSAELDEDLSELGDTNNNYESKYIKYFTAWINAKSRCISSAITGGSNFPVKRALKANDAEHRKWTEFREWRNRYFRAVYRVKTPSPEDTIENKCKKLDSLIFLNEQIKAVNKLISSGYRKGATNEEIIATIKDMNVNDMPDSIYKAIVDPIHWVNGKIWKLPPLSSRIRKIKDDIKILQARIKRKETWQDIHFDGGYVTLEDDRIKIFHDDKPDKETIAKIKSYGFKWSPNWSCWSRIHTGSAFYAAMQIIKPKLEEL